MVRTMNDEKWRVETAGLYNLQEKLNGFAKDGWLVAHIYSFDDKEIGPRFVVVFYRVLGENMGIPLGFKVL